MVVKYTWLTFAFKCQVLVKTDMSLELNGGDCMRNNNADALLLGILS